MSSFGFGFNAAILGAASVLTIQPSSVWKLDEPSGTLAADSVGGVPGTHKNSTVTVGTAGQVDLAVAYSGSGLTDFGNGPYQFERIDPFSISFWVKHPGAGAANQAALGAYSSASLVGWWIGVVDTGTIRTLQFQARNAAGNLQVRRDGAGNTLDDGLWHHAAITYDGSSISTGVRFYQDGAIFGNVVNSNSLSSGSIIGPASTMLAAYNLPTSPGAPLQGSLDDVAIFEGVLTPDDVTNIYQAGLAGISVADL